MSQPLSRFDGVEKQTPANCNHVVKSHAPQNAYGNFLLLRPYHGEHGPKVSVPPEYIVLQGVLRKRECMSILTKTNMHLISNGWLIKAT
jgi:hypothetical protein